MKKTEKATVLLGLLLFSLTGCGDSAENWSSTTYDSESNYVEGDVVIDFDIKFETPSKCNVYDAVIMSISEDSMNNYFFDEKAQKTVDGDNGSVLLDLDNKHGILSDSSFVFYTDNGNKFDDAASYFLNDPDTSSLDDSVEFAFATKKTAENEIRSFLDEVGLKSGEMVVEQAYGISKENFDEYKNFLEKTALEENDPKIGVQAENVSKINSEDFYYFDIGFSKDNIPIYSGGAYYYGEGQNDTFAGTRFTIVYTRNGIEYVSAFFIYGTDGIVESADIIDFSEAKELLKSKYENIFFDSAVTFDRSELVYLPFPQNTLNERFKRFILRPYYAFYGYQTAEIDGEIYRSDFVVYFDAITGKEL